MAATLLAAMASASGWECSQDHDKPVEYSQGGSYQVTLGYDPAKPSSPALLVISDALLPPGQQALVTRKGPELHHKTVAQEHWPGSSVREATAYSAEGARPLGEDKIDLIEAVILLVNAVPSAENLRDREKRAGHLEVIFRDGRVRRDLTCSYRAK